MKKGLLVMSIVAVGLGLSACDKKEKVTTSGSGTASAGVVSIQGAAR